MINLIPSVVRSAVIKEYWLRAASVYLFIISIVCIVVILFTLRLYFLISLQVDNYASSAEEATLRVAEYDLSAGALVRANVMAQKIFELRTVEYFSEVITEIESYKSSGVEIEGFEFARNESGGIAPVTVRGVATTRQDLANFRDALLKNEEVAEAVLPISNLAKDKDIPFSISVVFKETI
jgi:hypothetical protein